MFNLTTNGCKISNKCWFTFLHKLILKVMASMLPIHATIFAYKFKTFNEVNDLFCTYVHLSICLFRRVSIISSKKYSRYTV